MINVNNTLLSCIPQDELEDSFASNQLHLQTYGKNEVIHLEGEACKHVELVLKGEIVIERIGEFGDIMTVNRFVRGDMIGANLIFSNTNSYPMTITAKRPTEVVIIHRDLLLSLCNQYPDFLLAYLTIISDLSVHIGMKMKNRVSRTIRQSIITYLNKQYILQGSYCINLTMTKKALSEMFGVSRTSLSRELQSMSKEQLISYTHKTITILDETLIK